MAFSDFSAGISISKTVPELKRTFVRVMSIVDNVNTASAGVYEHLIDNAILEMVFEAHRENRLGFNFTPSDPCIDVDSEMEIFEEHTKKAQVCCCPNCKKTLSASRFAPHLQFCLVGAGRSSSRVASRRIADNCKEITSGKETDDDEEVWSRGPAQKKQKQKKKAGRKPKIIKLDDIVLQSETLSENIERLDL